MSNINWNQLFNNLPNNFNRVSTNNVQNTPLNTTFAQQSQQNNTAQTLFPNTTAQINQTAMQLAMLDQSQSVNLLKDLLNFSKNFDSLLSQLVINSSNINSQTGVLLLASSLNLGQLASLLQSNSKEAMTNLYQMLAQFNQMGLSVKEEQLTQLSKLIAFVASASTSDVQSLKATMLMYLPWLPLTDPDAFKLEIANKGSGGSSSSDDSVTILISTENYGNIQADIYKTEKDGIKIEFISSETFPQVEFNALMKEESRKYSININILFGKQATFNKQKNEVAKTQVSMNISPGVNPFLLLISNSVIKNIHLIDGKENLREQRKEKIDGKN